ncbi:MAG TPA: PspA/IM30 family protein [Terriglobia bacterium]|nr:PspA/IM30 family protein [Terriglobia bacterium]
MALLERVRTLVRANLNDLIDKAEDPEKMMKQLILDMENQLIQVKTQVAVSIADEHMLEKKQHENEEKTVEWMRKAELAVDKAQDDLARAALERHQGYAQMAENFKEQVADQKVQVENLKSALSKLEQKLAEARAKSDLLMAQHRRSRATLKASQAQVTMGDQSKMAAFDRLKNRVIQGQAASEAAAEMASDSLDDRLEKLDQEDRVEKLLAELKARRQAS